MMSFNKIIAILKKQVKDTLKNKSVLLQFVMFPILTIILTNSVKLDDMPDNFFVNQFGIMYIGMTPLVCISSIIAEEKESNTLRVLLMSNVKASEYLIGISTYVVFLCTIGSIVIGLQGDFSQGGFLRFMLLMLIGIFVSGLVGATVGIFSKNQMGATSLSVPLMVVFSLVPMLSIFNDSIKKYASVISTQQLSNVMNDIHADSIDTKALIIIGINAVVALAAFVILYRKKGLEN